MEPIVRSAIAIDPGVSGGIAWGQPGHVSAMAMPETHRDIITALKQISESFDMKPMVIMEATSGFLPRTPAARAFKFGTSYGLLIGCVMTLGLVLELVRAPKWQQGLSLGVKTGMTDSEWKRKLRAAAQRFYPELDVTLKTADALLILEFHHRGMMP